MAKTIQSISFNGRDDVKKVTINGGVYWEKQSTDHATMTVKMTSGVVPTYTGWTASLVSTAAEGDVYTLTKDDTAKPTSYDFYTNMAEKADLIAAEIDVDENVTKLANCFNGCSGLTSVNTSTWDTSNVTSMMNCFSGCSGLTSLNVSGFVTLSATNMRLMFNGCSSLTSLDVSNFSTANVTTMESMFNGCSGLTSLDLNSDDFTTANVTTMIQMFYICSLLETVNFSKYFFATSTTLPFENMTSWSESSFSDMADVAIEALNEGIAVGKSINVPASFMGREAVSRLDNAGYSITYI